MMKQSIVILFSFLFLLSAKASCAVADNPRDTLMLRDTIRDSVRVTIVSENQFSPDETFRKKKLITSVLAFPLPFGFIGLHRIYLGTEPWVPIVYLCTAGGGCGLLPLIDFLYIVTADEEEFRKYENNQKLFMFVE